MSKWIGPEDRIMTAVSEAVNKLYGDNFLVNNNIKFCVDESNCDDTEYDYKVGLAFKLVKICGMSATAISEDIVGICNKSLSAAQYATWKVSYPGFITVKINLNIKLMLADEVFRNISSNTLDIIYMPHEQNQTVVIDFSSPNLMKPMHVGHLRSTIIGDALSNIYEYLGFKVLRISHVGDFGAHFGLMLAYITHKRLEHKVKTMDIYEIAKIYQKAKQWEVSEDDGYSKIKVGETLRALQSFSDSEICDLWMHICDLSKQHNDIIYKLLGIEIVERGESFYQDMVPNMLEYLDGLALLHDVDGARAVVIENDIIDNGNLSPIIIQKADNTYNYMAFDITALQYRVTYDRATKIFYVVDEGQQKHFLQLFKLGCVSNIITKDVECTHVSYGVVLSVDGQRIKTRSGSTPLLMDLIDEAISYTKEKYIDNFDSNMHHKTECLTKQEIEQRCQILAINAIKMSDLLAQRDMAYTYSVDKLLGKNSGVVQIMYSYVRAVSILEKTGVTTQDYYKHKQWPYTFVNTCVDGSAQEEEFLFTLVKSIGIVVKSATTQNPHYIAQQLVKLSSCFRSFFQESKVIGSDRETFRTLLCELFIRVVDKMSMLLGLQMLPWM